jgi:hypothetical protein
VVRCPIETGTVLTKSRQKGPQKREENQGHQDMVVKTRGPYRNFCFVKYNYTHTNKMEIFFSPTRRLRSLRLILSNKIYVSASHHGRHKWSVGTLADTTIQSGVIPIFRSRNFVIVPAECLHQ